MEDFLEALASGEAAPGGGAATAAMAGMAAALLAMCCRLTLGRERYAGHEAELSAVLAVADQARRAAVALCAEDAAAWTEVMAALSARRQADRTDRTDRTDQADRTDRTDQGAGRLELAMRAATEVPLSVLALGGELARCFASVEDKLNPNVCADLRVGAIAARAAMQGAACNVADNLRSIRDQAYGCATRTDVERLMNEALPVLDRVAGGATHELW